MQQAQTGCWKGYAMNDIAWAGQLAAPTALAAGLLTCFLGYRLLKVTLGITGFIIGMAGGWALGMSLAPDSNVIALICALVAGVIGAGLCVWLFFLGIFLLGASAGAIAGAALFSVAASQTQPILLFLLAILFGLFALVLQKFMIIVSTAFGGSYLVTAGILHLLSGVHNVSPPWFDHLQPGSARDYVAFFLWLVFGVAGMSFQYKGSRTRDKAAHHQTQAA